MASEAKAPTHISLRPVVSTDHGFLVEVYGSTRAAEMAMVPWTEEQRYAFVESQFNLQQDHYSKKYPSADHDIVLSNEKKVGRLYVARLESEIRIVDITLLPTERNAGIGTYLLEQLLQEAVEQKKITRIFVEDFNPSLSLFKKLGFTAEEQHGFHLLMRWDPALQ